MPLYRRLKVVWKEVLTYAYRSMHSCVHGNFYIGSVYDGQQSMNQFSATSAGISTVKKLSQLDLLSGPIWDATIEPHIPGRLHIMFLSIAKFPSIIISNPPSTASNSPSVIELTSSKQSKGSCILSRILGYHGY